MENQSNQIKIKENTTTNQELQLLSEKAGRFYQQALFADWPSFRCYSGSQCCCLVMVVFLVVNLHFRGIVYIDQTISTALS